MALSAEFSLLHSELNDFLFAQIGEEETGAPLSVLSALTRLGVDPWAEGARLFGLPREVAAQALVSAIAKFPKPKRTSSEVLKWADQLAALLPPRAGDRATGPQGERASPNGMNAIAGCQAHQGGVFGLAKFYQRT
jgi:hypothetical protein